MNGLKAVRRQCNMTIQEVADKLNVSKQTVSAWEKGTKIIPDSRKKQLSQLFGVSENVLDIDLEKVSTMSFMASDCDMAIESLDTEELKEQSKERALAYAYFGMIRNEKEKQKNIERSMHSHFSCNEALPIKEQFHFIERANSLYGHFDNVIELLYQTKPEERNLYTARIQELLDTAEREMSKPKTKRNSKRDK
jgi:transcriptional regulator with XRE-family HTH domain